MANKKTRKRWTGYSIYGAETEKEYQSKLKKHRQWHGKDATLERKEKIGVGGALGRVFTDVVETAVENPLETAAVLYTGGAALTAVGAKQYVKTKSTKLIKGIKEKLGGKYVRKDKFKSTKDKSAKQRAEEQKTKFEKVRTRQVEDKRFKKGNVKRKQTEAYYEPSGRAVLEGLKKPVGLAASGVIGYRALTGKETTVGAATNEDKTTDSNLQKSNTTTKKRELEGRGMLKSSANTTKPKMDRKVVDGGINWATGGKLNGRAATDPNATNRSRYVPRQEGGELQDWSKSSGNNKTSTNNYKSVTSNYTRKKDHRGTRVERDTPRANVSGTNKRYSPTVSATKVNGNKKTRKMHLSERFRRSLGGR